MNVFGGPQTQSVLTPACNEPGTFLPFHFFMEERIDLYKDQVEALDEIFATSSRILSEVCGHEDLESIWREKIGG